MALPFDGLPFLIRLASHQGKAEGLFLYAAKVLDYSEGGGLRSLKEVEALPQGMEEWYEGQMRRLLKSLERRFKSAAEAHKALKDFVVPLLEVVLSARKPLPLEQLEVVLGSELKEAFGDLELDSLLQQCLDELTGFLSVIKKPGNAHRVRVCVCACVGCSHIVLMFAFVAILCFLVVRWDKGGSPHAQVPL